MALKLKTAADSFPKNRVIYEYSEVSGQIPFAPATLPYTNLPSYIGYKAISIPTAPPLEMPEQNLPRSVNYAADYGGCGQLRVHMPSELLNAHQKACISTLTQMVLDLNFYGPLKSVRLQRQATPVQKEFLKNLRQFSKHNGMRLIYEIDDVVFTEDIPDYNRCKEGFLDPTIRQCILDIMKDMDEITVTCPFMKEYYREKTGNQNITVVPNYLPKSWMGRFYNPEQILRNYEENKRRPRILYSGSGTHVDLAYKTGGVDDFHHVTTEIIKARKRFKFVWKGCFPLAVKPFIDSGEMEYIDWSILPNYGQGLLDTKCNATFAPLVGNNFNKCKSDIKMLEAGALGLPGAYQNLCTYENADMKFDTGEELISRLEDITKDVDNYMWLSKKAYEYTNARWLDDHLETWMGIYFTSYKSKERNETSPGLIALNPEQKFTA